MPGLRHVMQRVDLVSRSEVPVLILGETGTGKELVARAIHNRSDRHGGPFLRVNCGAIPRELIDSQLFGHERVASQALRETRQGWFERADMGTLFLDEIGELPLDAQVGFCACCKTDTSNASAGRNRFASMSASSRPRIATWRRWFAKPHFARTSGIASRCSRFCCRRFEIGSRTFPHWPSTSPERAAIRFGLAPGRAQRRRHELTADLRLAGQHP